MSVEFSRSIVCISKHNSGTPRPISIGELGITMAMFLAQTTQTAYLLSLDGLRRLIVDPARHATFLR